MSRAFQITQYAQEKSQKIVFDAIFRNLVSFLTFIL